MRLQAAVAQQRTDPMHLRNKYVTSRAKAQLAADRAHSALLALAGVVIPACIIATSYKLVLPCLVFFAQTAK